MNLYLQFTSLSGVYTTVLWRYMKRNLLNPGLALQIDLVNTPIVFVLIHL